MLGKSLGRAIYFICGASGHHHPHRASDALAVRDARHAVGPRLRDAGLPRHGYALDVDAGHTTTTTKSVGRAGGASGSETRSVMGLLVGAIALALMA
ncbi:hypothetical protein GUJ93_ZPchr0006g46036 [Zizania palustris]|uniref:Uncharacterized protein n=1 Tax=Zizania palustris TaxID=103762 RepID=A0A8J5TCG5_ZIZPA|nr:hypothetical protein GUJ93_ZPchr0006g46036 [Zizania palustris]